MPLSAQDMESRMKRMEELLNKMQGELKAKDDKIEKLEGRINQLNDDNKKKDLTKLSDDAVPLAHFCVFLSQNTCDL